MTMTPADWLNMTPSDWMRLTPSDWMGRTVSEWMSTSYEDLIRTKPGDWWSKTYGAQRHKAPHHEPCCRRCESDPCQCECCIGDVDFAIYARVGEQRVIPILVENERRREKQITLELSNWTTRGGKPAPVQTVLLE